jgi:hypothetical protein
VVGIFSDYGNEPFSASWREKTVKVPGGRTQGLFRDSYWRHELEASVQLWLEFDGGALPTVLLLCCNAM